MKVKDGFKFGIGYCVATGTLSAISTLILVLTDKDGEIRKNANRLMHAVKNAGLTKTIGHIATGKNKIGFAIE